LCVCVCVGQFPHLCVCLCGLVFSFVCFGLCWFVFPFFCCLFGRFVPPFVCLCFCGRVLPYVCMCFCGSVSPFVFMCLCGSFSPFVCNCLWVSVLSFRFLNNFTYNFFYKICHKNHAIGRHHKFVNYNFIRTVRVTWRTRQLISWNGLFWKSNFLLHGTAGNTVRAAYLRALILCRSDLYDWRSYIIRPLSTVYSLDNKWISGSNSCLSLPWRSKMQPSHTWRTPATHLHQSLSCSLTLVYVMSVWDSRSITKMILFNLEHASTFHSFIMGF
jgi:hypothetical protein